MPTPQELRKISEVASREKSQQEELEKTKRQEEKSKREVETALLAQQRAKAAILHAEANMTKVAKEGLSAALVYLIEPHEVAEANLRSLGSGDKVDSPDKYFCQGAAKMVFDHFKDTGFAVVIVSKEVFPESEGAPCKLYYIKVGW